MALPIYATPGQRIWHYCYMAFCIFVLFFLVAPLVAVIPLSFTSTPFLNFTPEMLALDPDGYSVRWYKSLFGMCDDVEDVAVAHLVGGGQVGERFARVLERAQGVVRNSVPGCQGHSPGLGEDVAEAPGRALGDEELDHLLLEGLEVVLAEDGRKGLDALEARGPFDLVLTDIMMPVLDGFAVIREIRRSPEHQSLPIIALTAKAMPGDRDRCLEAGASDYVSKPIDTDRLIPLLRIWLHRSGPRVSPTSETPATL